VHFRRGVVGEQQQQRTLEPLALCKPFEQHADDRRVDERRLAEIDDERRVRAERSSELGPEAWRDVRVRFAGERDHTEIGGRHTLSIAR